MDQPSQISPLPQARMYLKIAQWGFDEMVSKKLIEHAFRLHLVAILASLRAVQHALRGHDRTLSDEHKRVIDAWWKSTPLTTPDLHFIRTSRNMMLKRGSFSAYATHSESATGEGENREITGEDYDLAYYDDDHNRHDLGAAITSAIRWCDQELSILESKLPAVDLPP